MSSTAQAAPAMNSPHAFRWSLWRRQALAIMRLEVKKNFLGKRAILIYLMALAPVFLFAALAAVGFERNLGFHGTFADIAIVFANMYEGLILRTIVFFGCAWIFMNLFRGEVVDKSLHYYFLAPLRREVLVAGKYLSGLVVSTILFTLSTAASVFFLYLAASYPANVQYLKGPGLGQAFSYIGITALACVGYGAFFLVIGLFFRNPMIPAITVYGWEWINFLLPPVLKRISVVHYLHSLAPVPVPEGPFALVGEPSPVWVSVFGLVLVSALVLAFAGFRIRRMEIKYGGE